MQLEGVLDSNKKQQAVAMSFQEMMRREMMVRRMTVTSDSLLMKM